jgi:hypothetical protein
VSEVIALPVRPSSRIRLSVIDMIDRMAAALVTYEATTTEADAVRCLYGRGFPIEAIALHAGEALIEAQRLVVDRTMGQAR